MLFFILIITSLLLFAVYRYRRRRMYELASHFAGPKELPQLAHKFIGNTEAIMRTMMDLNYTAMKNNGAARLWLGHILYIVMVDPVDVEYILKTCLEKDDLHRFLREIVGNGSLFAPVSIWRRRRKILAPAFSPKSVDNFVYTFVEQSEKLVSLLEAHDGGEKFCLWPYISTFTLDSICETVIGVKVNSQDNPDTPLLICIWTLLNILCKRIFHIWLQPNSLYKLFPIYKEQEKQKSFAYNFFDNIIKNKRKEIAMKREKGIVQNEYDIKLYNKQSLLDFLITNSGGERGFTNVEIREELMTFITAGMDTTAIAISSTLKLLSKYPEIQEKVYEELYDVFGNSDRSPVKEDLIKLKYLERVLKESMRLFPPVPLTAKKIEQEVTLPSGRKLPAGSGVVVSIWGLHRDPKYWGPDVEKFDPDRFLPERYKVAKTCSYIPFSSGPRNCVGLVYAMISMKIALSTILRKYRMVAEPETSSTPQIKLKMDITMKDTEHYEIAIERRTRTNLNQ